MKITGLIAEYNPFHNGHQYHIENAKKVTGADRVIVVMSGNFVQRGMPAIIPKHIRAEVALRAGADLVIELPVYYACASAEFFAFGAVSLLNSLNCVDSICFGSECGDISLLQQAASILKEEPESYKICLQTYLRNGDPFPVARQKAFHDCVTDKNLSTVLEQPNNILGIEYLKALLHLNSSMKAFTIHRQGSGYHETKLHKTYSSASAIRQLIKYSGELDGLKGHVPGISIPLMEEHHLVRYPLYSNDFSLLLKYRLLIETAKTLSEYMDVSSELANRIMKCRNQFVDFDQFCNLLKTKDLTYSRISRALLHILLQIKTTDFAVCLEHRHFYIHVLGFRKEGADILTKLKKCATIPILTKLTSKEQIIPLGQQMLHTDIFASDLYESVVTNKFKTPFINEYEQQIVRI